LIRKQTFVFDPKFRPQLFKNKTNVFNLNSESHIKKEAKMMRAIKIVKNLAIPDLDRPFAVKRFRFNSICEVAQSPNSIRLGGRPPKKKRVSYI